MEKIQTDSKMFQKGSTEPPAINPIKTVGLYGGNHVGSSVLNSNYNNNIVFTGGSVFYLQYVYIEKIFFIYT